MDGGLRDGTSRGSWSSREYQCLPYRLLRHLVAHRLDRRRTTAADGQVQVGGGTQDAESTFVLILSEGNQRGLDRRPQPPVDLQRAGEGLRPTVAANDHLVVKQAGGTALGEY